MRPDKELFFKTAAVQLLGQIDDMWTFGPHYFLIHKPTRYSMNMAARFAEALDINIQQPKRCSYAKARTTC